MKKIKVGNSILKVKFAKKPNELTRGLMNIKNLPENEGMLFCYGKEQLLSFWMKNTTVPLSIAFIDKNKKITQIEDLQPLNEKSVKSLKPAKWALEVNQGWFKENNIKTGDKLSFFDNLKIKINII